MARYGPEHKQATRERIVESAARRLKKDGIDGSGIATLMADAGLTNGAFYAHFDSKDALVATVVAEELSAQAARLHELPKGRAGLEEFLREYLSPDHRDNPDVGCPSAALLDEIGKSTPLARKAFTKGAALVLEEIATHLDPDDPKAARRKAAGIFAMAVGTLQLSRALANKKMADVVLAQGIENAVALLDT